MRIFRKAGDYAAFVKLLEEGRERTGLRILGYCLMSNHWHLLLWPRRGGELSKFIGWICTTHVRRWREHRANVGEGHLYQGRYKSFIVQDDSHFLTVARYVEANPLRAKLVRRAEEWPWSSLGAGLGADGKRVRLTEWPVDKPGDWPDVVNGAIDGATLTRLRTSVARNRPFGGDSWLARTVERMGLQSTTRDPWRPQKKVAKRKLAAPDDAS